ncbi:IS110 family transposase [Lachnospiraceae bacterium MD1]|uniref:IS110 family transposase n=1 Tax=Variimorphobacter saccharofermentans TaxID=2755051 RepID=A0A839K0Q7_9FIRM|nr:IS110 family transposase [Variimorphobacter saccharofermentans]MBB2183503.1 IS110 family transposase [Variimorphobacter saccharofermentans]
MVPFAFSNDHSGFQKLLKHLDSYSKEELYIGMESTAHYAENLTSFLFTRGFQVCIINPIQTSSLRKSNIRKTKTDSVDTYLIIKALTLNHYHLYSERDYNSLQLKNLCRFRQKLMKARTKVKIQLVTYVDLLFPELQYFFKSGIHGKACYTLLKEQPNPDRIAKMHLTRLTNLLSKSSRGHFKQSKAVHLKELASQSVGIKNDTLSLQILQSIKQIEMYTEQLAEVDQSIHEIMDKMDSVIKTIPGVGAINGAMIIGEIGDISRFDKPCQLLAYAGLDPSVYQSGNFTAARTRMSKRGSKLLRYALINAAWQTTLVNKTFKEYYDLKVSQGRRHYNALGHVAHKLVRVIHKMMSSNVEFNLA